MMPTVIHEDNDILVLNKPAGLVVHGDGRTKEATLSDWLVAHYPHMATVGEPWVTDAGETIARPGIVHRLDRETSGVMVVAKTQEAFEHLKAQFQAHTVRKTYRAFVHGAFKEAEGDIDRPIQKSKSDFRKWSAQRGGRGTPREAHTHWRVLATYDDGGEKYTYIELTPTTGRTHQLRVHMKAIHHPIIGDRLYAPAHARALGFERTALHAHTLSFVHPSGERVNYEAPLPDDFIRVVREKALL